MRGSENVKFALRLSSSVDSIICKKTCGPVVGTCESAVAADTP